MASSEFRATIKVDIRDSEPDWTPFEPARAPDRAPSVLYISGDPYVDLERAAAAMIARE